MKTSLLLRIQLLALQTEIIEVTIEINKTVQELNEHVSHLWSKDVSLLRGSSLLNPDHSVAESGLVDEITLLAIEAKSVGGNKKDPIYWFRFDMDKVVSQRNTWYMNPGNRDAINFVAKVDIYFYGFGIFRTQEENKTCKYKVAWGVNESLGEKREFTYEYG